MLSRADGGSFNDSVSALVTDRRKRQRQLNHNMMANQSLNESSQVEFDSYSNRGYRESSVSREGLRVGTNVEDFEVLMSDEHIYALIAAVSNVDGISDVQLGGYRDMIQSQRELATFVVVGRILHKLYYEDSMFSNQKEFLKWSKEQLHFSKSTTYEYIISYRVYDTIVRQCGDAVRPPVYQSHCQHLSKIPQEHWVEVWKDICNTAPDGAITTNYLEQYLRERNLKSLPKKRTRGGLSRVSSLATPASCSTGTRASSRSISSPESVSGVSNIPPPPPPHSNSSVGGRVEPRAVDESTILSQSYAVIGSEPFDMLLRTSSHFQSVENALWHGRVWANLSGVLPVSTMAALAGDQVEAGGGNLLDSFLLSEAVCGYNGGLERMLFIIFTKFARKEFNEGVFLLPAEFGADWFTPLLQNPYCIIRHTPNVAAKSNAPIQFEFDDRLTKNQVELVESFRKLRSQRSMGGGFTSFIVFYLGPNVQSFCNAFRGIGTIPGINSWTALVNLGPDSFTNVADPKSSSSLNTPLGNPRSFPSMHSSNEKSVSSLPTSSAPTNTLQQSSGTRESNVSGNSDLYNGDSQAQMTMESMVSNSVVIGL